MKIRVALYFSTVAKPLCVELPNDVVDLVDWGSEVIGWRGRMTAKTYADALEEGGAVYLHKVAAANQRADRDGDGEVNEEEFLRIMKKTNLF